MATGIAVLAYINSTEKPSLLLHAAYPGAVPLEVRQSKSEDNSGPSMVLRGATDWWLQLGLKNIGPVAARFVAIQVSFEASRIKLESTDLQPWQPTWEASGVTNTVRWEGGPGAVVHPLWDYQAPQLGPMYLILMRQRSEPSFYFTVQVVADDIKPFSQTFTIHVPPEE